MKKTIRIAAALAILVLASCSDGLPDIGAIMTVPAQVEPEGFYELLASEYSNLAAYERDYMESPEDAAYFEAKARRALRRQDVAPDSPESRRIPDFAASALTDARAQLTDALATLRTPGNEALLAMAQTRYDCWLALQEKFPQETSWISCKDEFFSALELLALPPQEKELYSVYFDEGSTELNDEARETVKEIAGFYADRQEWSVVLRGYTDAKGSRSANQVLAMRRAIAVKNLLGQYGVDLDSISIGAEGVADSAGAGTDADRESRRVDIAGGPSYVAENDTGDLRTLPGWRHSGEF